MLEGAAQHYEKKKSVLKTTIFPTERKPIGTLGCPVTIFFSCVTVTTARVPQGRSCKSSLSSPYLRLSLCAFSQHKKLQRKRQNQSPLPYFFFGGGVFALTFCGSSSQLFFYLFWLTVTCARGTPLCSMRATCACSVFVCVRAITL